MHNVGYLFFKKLGSKINSSFAWAYTGTPRLLYYTHCNTVTDTPITGPCGFLLCSGTQAGCNSQLLEGVSPCPGSCWMSQDTFCSSRGFAHLAGLDFSWPLVCACIVWWFSCPASTVIFTPRLWER